MATKFLEPGGDADFAVNISTANGFWGAFANGTIATDFVHGTHVKSIRCAPGGFNRLFTPPGVAADAGTRVSFYLYLVALPSADAMILQASNAGSGTVIFKLMLTSVGVLKIIDPNTLIQKGTNGTTLSTGTWYRISVAYTFTSTTVNRVEQFVNGISSISITNASWTAIGTDNFGFGNNDGNSTLDVRNSDFYVDNSSSLTDPGDIWVTAKRPFSNGTTNGFTTQVGAGGSGYGTGHAPQVNERPLSTTNGWSMVGAGSAITEEYTIEGASVGDMDISGKTLVDWAAWVSSGATVGELASIITGGARSTYQCGTVTRLVTAYKGSTTYPAGGTDVGVLTTTALSTLSLFEAGVLIAFLGPPNSASVTSTPISNLLTLGVG